jgi:hypothetical protein
MVRYPARFNINTSETPGAGATSIHPRRSVAAIALLASLLSLAMIFANPMAATASEKCDPPNVMPRDSCEFNNFRGSPPRQLPSGWNEFILSGDAGYSASEDTFWGPPSLMIRGSGTYKLGIYTQVPVTPGAGYRAGCAWCAPTNPASFGRQLGIDPTGGADPNSPNVIWGPMHWGEGRILDYPPPDVNIDVKARALGDTLTVFVLVDHPRVVGDDLIFIDAVYLLPDESAPAVEIPPTDTPVPPTPEPVIIAAAPTATPLPTETPTPTETPVPTMTPTFTATPSPLPTATPTFTATWTPWPSATSSQLSFSAAQGELLDAVQTGANAPILLVGLIGFGSAGLFGSSWWAMRRKRRRR